MPTDDELAAFYDTIGDLTPLAVNNVSLSALDGRHAMLRETHKLAADAIRSESPAAPWLLGLFASTVVMMLDDLGAALFAGSACELIGFGERLTTCRSGDVAPIFKALASDTWEDGNLLRALGVPETGQWRRHSARGATNADCATLQRIRGHIVEVMTPRLRGIARTQRRWSFLHNKFKHSVASVVLLGPDRNEGLPVPVLVAIEHADHREERRQGYPVRLEALDALAWAAEEATTHLQSILNARRFQLMLRDPFVLPPSPPLLDEAIAGSYQDLLTRHYTGAEATELTVSLEVTGIRLDDPWLTGDANYLRTSLQAETWPVRFEESESALVEDIATTDR